MSDLNLKALHSAGDARRGSARKFFTFSRKFLGADRAAGPEGRVLRFALPGASEIW